MQVFNELLAEIERIPAVDVHSNIRFDSPAASDLSEIVLGPEICAELEAAGLDPKVLELDSVRKRLTEAAARLPRLQNTSTFWCLSRILGDLYGTTGAAHEIDLESLWGTAEGKAADPGWADSVMERANVKKSITGCDWRRRMPESTDSLLPAINVGGLINGAHTSRTLDSLAEVTGQSVYEVADLKKAVIELFRNAKQAGTVAATAAFEPAVDFEQGDRDAADRILSLVLLGQKVNRDDMKAVRSYVMDLALAACAEHAMPMQLMLGVHYMRAAGRNIAAFEPAMLAMYTDLFTRHPNVRFDVFSSSATLNHELTVVARNYRNVFMSGSTGYLNFPTHIRKTLRERVEMLPITKSCALASDARCVEWLYGRSVMVRRELAFALAGMITEGYISQGAALEVAQHYLWDNPRRIYGIE